MKRTAHSLASPATLALGALGIVFGDIGTSPLYTLQVGIAPEPGVHPALGAVFGPIMLLPNPSQWGVTPETARLLQHWRQHTRTINQGKLGTEGGPFATKYWAM